MDAIVKASLYIGTILLVGAGGYVHFINPHIATRSTSVSRRLFVAMLLGLAVVIAGSILNLTLTVMTALGSRFDTPFLWQYATHTQHGKMTFIRLGLAGLLVPLSLVTKWKWVSKLLFSLAALGFLATFSVLSHAAVMDGSLPFFADLIHFSAASLWVGAVVFSVLTKVWQRPQFESVMKRVSTTALVCVALLVSTGIYTSLIHIKMFKSFVQIETFAPLLGTNYGRILIVKVILFSLILFLAALNRWYFMPKLLVRSDNFRRVLWLEVMVLLAVLCVTGLLTMSALPHD
jgi:copper resistance protein D